MNQRIRQLAADARGQMVVLTAVDDKEWKRHEEFVEKFAELIVKKCMAVAKYHTPDTEECEHTWLIHDKIGKHFGVKE